MSSPRWTKLLRDVHRALGRVFVLVGTLAIICMAFTALLVAYSVLSRESARDYEATHPADAQILLDRADEQAVASVRSHPQVLAAEAGGMVRGWIAAKDFWMPLQIFVVPDFTALQINSVQVVSGSRSPTSDALLIDSGGLRLLGAREGARVRLRLSGDSARQVVLAGVVHDAGIAPASIEGRVTAYATTELLSRLGQPSPLDRLKLVFRLDALATSNTEALALDVARNLGAMGYSIREIQIPPRGAHPHQLLNDSLLVVLIAFGVLGLIASGVLTRTLMGGLLESQVREMGIMKAIGASSRDVAHMYLVFVAILAALSALIGVLPGIIAARVLARILATSMNVELASLTAPGWTFIVPAAVLVLTAVHAASTRILLAANRSVRECLVRNAASENPATLPGGKRLTIGRVPASFQLGVRLALRHRRALLSNAFWVAIGGGLFIGSFNVVASWNSLTADVNEGRRYDAEIQLHEPATLSDLAAQVRPLTEVAALESWPIVPAALAPQEGLAVSHTYPDGDHGQLYLRGTTVPTELVHLPIEAGRWLRPTDRNAAVLNPRASVSMFHNARPGDSIRVMVQGSTVKLRVVGIATEVLTGATVYASPDVVASLLGSGHEDAGTLTNSVLIRFRSGTESRAALRAVVARLETAGLAVRAAFTISDLEVGQRAHAQVVSRAATVISALMLIVATCGLSAALGSQVARQSREIGVLRAIGAKDREAIQVLVTEALCAAVTGALLALPVAALITVALIQLIRFATALPMPMTIAPFAPVVWTGAVLICAVLASIAPSVRALRVTVREALSG